MPRSIPFPRPSIMVATLGALLIAVCATAASDDLQPIEPDYRLPEWYENHRAHLHTRFGTWMYLMQDPVPELAMRAEEYAAEMGASVFTRHVKSRDEGAWYPSKIGAVVPKAKERNWVKEMIDRAHANDLHMFLYYKHHVDEWFARERPEAVVRNIEGEFLPRGESWLSFHSGYPEFLEKRLVEMAEMGADGFYFDFIHQPTEGDYSELTRKKFQKATGLEPPKKTSADDPGYLPYLKFKIDSMKRTFGSIRRALHKVNPECVTLLSVTFVPMLSQPQMDSDLCRYGDAVKTEMALPVFPRLNAPFLRDKSLHKPDPNVRLAVGYSLLRGACRGRPAHVWTHVLFSREEAMAMVAGIATYDHIANLDVREQTMPNPIYTDALKLGDLIGPHMAYADAEKWVAVLHSESARNRHLPDEVAVYRQAILPMTGAFEALMRHGAPVGVVVDGDLRRDELEGYRMIVAPNRADLADEIEAGLARYEKAGGKVLDLKAEQRFCEAPEREQAMKEVYDQVVKALGPPPVSVEGGPAKKHVASYSREGFDGRVIMLANDFAWVENIQRRIRWVPKAQRDENNPIERDEPGTPPPPVEGVTVVLNDGRVPKRVTEAVTGKTLVAKTDGSTVRIEVPSFPFLALLSLEY